MDFIFYLEMKYWSYYNLAWKSAIGFSEARMLSYILILLRYFNVQNYFSLGGELTK